MKKYFILLMMILVEMQVMAAPILLSANKIWDEAPHNAFTDLIYFQNKFLCCFRESASHEGGSLGKIRIISSPDGIHWDSMAILTKDGHDLRDPKLSITPSGRLLLNMGATVWKNSTFVTLNSAVAFSSDGANWGDVRVLPYKGEWMWRVTWNGNQAYTASYSLTEDNDTQLKLFSSADGIMYNKITDLQIPNSPNETTLRFLPDHTLVALVRRNGGPGLIGTSKPPYQEWKWFNTEYVLGGPNFLILENGKMWASSREIVGQEATCILARMDTNLYDPVLTLPSGGDCSYPGMVFKDGKLYVSYYSSQTGKACIYFAVIQP